MARETVQTDEAPAAIGTYSQAVVANGIAYLSGQIPLDPETGELVDGGIEVQIQRVFENLQALAKAAGMSLKDAVKLNVYLTDLGNFGHINAIMMKYFDVPYPARAAVEVSALPKGASVEIEAILVPDEE